MMKTNGYIRELLPSALVVIDFDIDFCSAHIRELLLFGEEWVVNTNVSKKS